MEESGARADTKGGLAWPLAAPSCVLRAGVAANAAFLAQRFDEIALAFFETEACLAYGEDDLPAGLAKLPVRWHVHLPLDLPWQAGVPKVAEAVLALKDRAAHLRPGRFVLHPPQTSAELAALAELLARGGLEPGALLVENIQGRDLALHWPVVRDLGLGVCLDLGHMLVHGQEDFLDLPGLEGRLSMLHLNAPHPDKPLRHASLALLGGHGRALMARMLELLPPGLPVVLELFGEAELFESLGVLRGLLGQEPAPHGDRA